VLGRSATIKKKKIYIYIYISWRERNRESYDRKMMSEGIVKNTVYSMDWFLFVSMMNRITASVLKVSDQCTFLCVIHISSHCYLIVRFSPVLVPVFVRYVDAS